MALLSSIGTAHARDYFNPALLEIDNPLRGADLSVFEENSSQAPGNYRADLYLNGEQIDSLDVEFRLMPGADGKQALQPCFSTEKLAELGVRVAMFPAMVPGDSCVNLAGHSTGLCGIPVQSAEAEFEHPASGTALECA